MQIGEKNGLTVYFINETPTAATAMIRFVGSVGESRDVIATISGAQGKDKAKEKIPDRGNWAIPLVRMNERTDVQVTVNTQPVALSAAAISPAYDGQAMLFNAARSGDLNLLEQAFALGAKINAPFDLNNSTALMMAADRGYVNIVKALLARSDNKDTVNAQTKQGATALYNAALSCRI